jgi:serine protease Do
MVFVAGRLRRRPRVARWGMALALACCLTSALAAQPAVPATRPASFPAVTPRTADELRRLQDQIENVASKVMPAVVTVVVSNPRQGTASEGSGVVVSKDGLVLTAAHVTYDTGRTVMIVFPNGDLANGVYSRGRALGLDRQSDAAMVQITDAGPFPFVELGPAELPRAGTWCVALGQTSGFLRGRSPPMRLGRVLTTRENMIMSSCALAAGDSGGPLFDLEGRLIGINSRIGSENAYNIHVSISAFTQSWDRLLKSEVWGAPLPSLGGPIIDVPMKDTENGIQVVSVEADSPAANAGLKAGDIIAKFNGVVPANVDELQVLIGRRRPGDSVPLEILRDKNTLIVTVVIQARD